MAKASDGATAQAEAASSSSMEPYEETLKFIDFKMEMRSAECVQGRFIVSEKSAQPFGVLHGGVSALIAEALASAGAFLAAGLRRVAGVQLTINHLKAAPVGTEVLASAKPIHLGKRLHVWDVLLSKVDNSSPPAPEITQGTRIALARVTLMVVTPESVVKVDEQGKPLSRL